MYLIKIEANDSGSRPPLQKWENDFVPKGFVLCPEEFYEIFYSTSPAGFVDIEVEDGMVVSMAINQDALDTYQASLPEVEGVEAVTEPSQLDRIEAQVTYTAMMTDTLLEE